MHQLSAAVAWGWWDSSAGLHGIPSWRPHPSVVWTKRSDLRYPGALKTAQHGWHGNGLNPLWTDWYQVGGGGADMGKMKCTRAVGAVLRNAIAVVSLPDNIANTDTGRVSPEVRE